MDLKLEEVSEILGISEATVMQWSQEGTIPAYQLGSQYRFNREEVEDFLMRHKPELPISKGIQQFGLTRAIHRGGVLEAPPHCKTKEAVIAWTAEQLAMRYSWDAAVLTELLLDREALQSTALGSGIAVPHARDFLIDTHFDVIATVFVNPPLPYEALDDKPVHTLFFLFACEDRRHLNLLAKIAYFVCLEEHICFLQTRPSSLQCLAYVKKWEESLISCSSESH